MILKLAVKDITKYRFRTAAVVITVVLACVMFFFGLVYNRLVVGQFMETVPVEAENADLRLAYTASSSARTISDEQLGAYADEIEYAAGVLELFGSAVLNEKQVYIVLRGATEENIDRLNDLTYIAEPQTRSMRKHEIVVCDSFAREYNLSLNSTLKIKVGSKTKTFSVGKIAEDHPCFVSPGAAVIFGMDSFVSEYISQVLFGKVYNKIFIKTVEGVDKDILGERIMAIKEYDGFTVKPENTNLELMSTAKLIAQPVTIAAACGVLLAIFLIFMIFDTGIRKQTEAVSRLKSIGAGNGFVSAVFLSQCLFYIVFGAGLGYLCNRFLFSKYLHKLIDFDAADPFFGRMMLLSSLICAATVFIMSLLPVLKTRRVAVRTSFTASKNTIWKGKIIVPVIGAAFLIAAVILVLPYERNAYRGIISLFLTLSGGIIVAPYIARGISAALNKVLDFGASGLALTNVRKERGTAGILRILVAGLAICAMIGSAARATHNILLQTSIDLDSDIVVHNIRAQTEAPIDDIKSIEGVYDVYAFQRHRIDFRFKDKKAYIFLVGIARGSLGFLKNDSLAQSLDELSELLAAKDGMLLNSSYARLLGIKLGDEIPMTIKGKTHNVAVRGFFDSYMDFGRTALMSNELMAEMFDIPLYDTLVCKTDGDVAQTVAAIRTLLGTHNIVAISKTEAFALYLRVTDNLVNFSKVFSGFIILVCLAGIITNILNSLDERRNVFYQLISLG